jgi:hypothetical protein
MSYYASSNAGSNWTPEGLFTPAGGSATTERGDTSQYGYFLQDLPGEFTTDERLYLGIPASASGPRSPKSASLAAVGGQFLDSQPADHTEVSVIPWPDASLESSAGVHIDTMVPPYGIAQICDQFSAPGNLKRRRDSGYQQGRGGRSSRRVSLEAPLMSKGPSNTSTSTANTGFSGRRKGPLTEQQRQNARDVRALGACWRCHSLKAKVNTSFWILQPPRS